MRVLRETPGDHEGAQLAESLLGASMLMQVETLFQILGGVRE
ncbi:MAG: hypothetical protein ACRELA_24725 [Candidatus Rokuibacteriota bacterium]